MDVTIVMPSGVSTYVVDASEYAGCAVRFGGESGITYDVSFCGDAALYYLSSTGAWDAFLIEGKVVKTDTFTQQDLYKSYDNTTIEFGRKRFLTEITSNWELNTGWLSNAEAKRLVNNLFPSTQVYLHLLDEDKILPVVITDKNAQYKTYENQNYQLVSYKINVSASQDATRAI